MAVQFIVWSVDPVETQLRWIKDVQERTGVEIGYPLIGDGDKRVAERYGILHKEKEVTHRRLFIIDPDGVLKFAATYPLQVGRNTRKLERIIKLVKKARELSHLKELDRTRELGKHNE